MLASMPNQTYPFAQLPVLISSTSSGNLALPDTFEALERFLREEGNDNIDEDTGGRGHVKSLLKMLGGKYIGRVALWLYDHIRATAERVVSHPQEGVPGTFKVLKPVETHSQAHGSLSEIAPNPSRRVARLKQRQLEKSTGSRQAMKRKSSSDSEKDVPFQCVQHKKVFTGKWAETNYTRHMNHTKEHQCQMLKCVCGKEVPRVDHLKNHRKKCGTYQQYVHNRSEGAGGSVELQGSPV